MIGVALRIAQRIGIHSEMFNSRCSFIEAEMRRRLWWSLVLFETRIGEITDNKMPMLAQIWDCKIPLGINESDLRAEVKSPPSLQTPCSDALFVVVRGEIADFVRHTRFYLDFTNPTLKGIIKRVDDGPIPEEGEILALNRLIEDKYLKYFNPEIPLHFLTIWMARGFVARFQLIEHYSNRSNVFGEQTDEQNQKGVALAIKVMECDTMVVGSPLAKGFLWMIHFYFPFPAYVQLIQELRQTPFSPNSDRAWKVIQENYTARLVFKDNKGSQFFRMFMIMIHQAWEARELAAKQEGKGEASMPEIVKLMRESMPQETESTQTLEANMRSDGSVAMNLDDMPMWLTPNGFGINLPFGMNPGTFPLNSMEFSGLTEQSQPGTSNMNQFTWPGMNWNV
jgi:hypothetical protein